MSASEPPVRDELFDAMLGDFLDESGQLLDRLNENLLQLDEWVRALDDDHQQRCDEELLNEMFRSAHSLKGLSAMLGLADINELTHKIENVFDAARKDDLVIDRDVVELMFHGVDRLVGLVGALRDPEARPDACDSVAEGIQQLLQRSGVERRRTSQADAETAMSSVFGELGAGSSPSAPCETVPPEPPPGADPFDNLQDESEISDTYLALFIDETEQSLNGLTELLLALEGEGDCDKLKQVLVIAHRIKGSAASLGLNRAAKLAHLMEDLLQNLVESGSGLSGDLTDAMLKCADELRTYSRGLRTATPRTDRFSEVARLLLAVQTVGGPAEAGQGEPPPDVAATPSPQPAPEPSKSRPAPKATPPARDAQHQRAKSATTETPAADGGGRPTETLRVDIERLDQLMNLSGQLVINRARLSRIGDGLKGATGSRQSLQALNRISHALEKMTSEDGPQGTAANLRADFLALKNQARRVQAEMETIRRDVEAMSHVRSSVNDLFEAIHQLDRVSDSIQQSVMDTRMLPIGPLFARFKRVIRDITRGNGKDIRLVINGEKTELDKRMIDELSDPLIHIVRNSADHGIEPPEIRLAAGKPAQGTVTLDAFHRGNSIVIRVTDDGKGLDPRAIRRKAVEKGLITEFDAEKMTAHQIYQLIWEPGLTTAEKVTQVSGRGMGMDIVKSKIEELNGVVDLESEPGKGTTLTIKLPLTLAILPSLMVNIGEDVFAMPLESVVEIVRVHKKHLATVHGRWTARVRNRVISVVRLEEVLAFRSGRIPTAQSLSDETTLVVVGAGAAEIGLAVDRVLGEEDVVIKSMAENYRNVPGVAGASILGDGRVSLILDLVALIDLSCQKANSSRSASESPS